MKKYALLIIGILFFYCNDSYAQSKIWSLQDCIQYAIEHNVTVKKTELDKTTAELNYKQSKYNRMPSLSGSISGNISNGAAVDPITSNFVNQQVFSNNYGLSGSLTLYQGGKLNLQIQQNKILLQKSDLYIQASKNDITLSIIEAYIQALYYNEGITIAENTLNSSTEELKQTQIKFNNGAISQLELSNMETQNSNNEYNVVTAKNQYAQQVLELKQLLELNLDDEFEIQNLKLDDIAIVIPNKEEVFKKAVATLPDLKIYDLAQQSLEKSIKIARAAYLPTISLGFGLSSGYTTTMDYDYGYQLKTNFKQYGSLSLNIPIFSKLQERTNIRLAKVQLQQNDLDKVATTKALYSKIETAYQNAVVNEAQATSSQKTRDNAKLAYELASKKYSFGGLTATDLSVSRNTYLNAEQTYLQNKYLTVLYQYLLDFYQGKSLTNIQ
ncbi:MAG: TolC family protein [Chitinophagales bacterium]